MSVVVDLFKGLQLELNTLLGGNPEVERRYMPLINNNELTEMRISLYMESFEREEIARGVIDADRFTFGLAIQQSVADQVDIDENGIPVLDGIDNITHGDSIIDKVEQIKSYWRAGGPLRDKLIAGCRYVSMTHDPIYEPMHLSVIGVYSSIIDLTYEFSGE